MKPKQEVISELEECFWKPAFQGFRKSTSHPLSPQLVGLFVFTDYGKIKDKPFLFSILCCFSALN